MKRIAQQRMAVAEDEYIVLSSAEIQTLKETINILKEADINEGEDKGSYAAHTAIEAIEKLLENPDGKILIYRGESKNIA